MRETAREVTGKANAKEGRELQKSMYALGQIFSKVKSDVSRENPFQLGRFFLNMCRRLMGERDLLALFF